jgi:predicted NAD-dependent protein-ADP-ribosyltransferase YbiA (DUF1768 family)
VCVTLCFPVLRCVVLHTAMKALVEALPNDYIDRRGSAGSGELFVLHMMKELYIKT